MTRTTLAALGLVAALAGAAHADIVAPNANAGVEGPAVFSLTSTTAGGRTFQLNIDSGQLTGAVGQQITGLQWRLNGGAAAWPGVDTNYAFWDVFIGAGVDPSAMSNTFAANFTGVPTQVRSGPATILANSFSGGATPNAFGATLGFTTPYLYTGGDLTIEMRFATQSGATNQPALDAIAAAGGPANGFGVDFSARWTGNSAGVTGGNANFLVTNLVTIIPAPSSLALLGLSMGLISRRRR